MSVEPTGVPEPAQARDNTPFYRDRGASAVMRAAHFPDELLSFFQMESLAVLEASKRYGCSTLVEFGCYDGRSLEVARAAGIDYLGVDVNAEAVALLRRRIADEQLEETASGVVGDALRSEDWVGAIHGGRPLLLLPFNLLGNFADPALVLTSIREVDGIALLSVFTASDTATALRRDYYRACGISPLEEQAGPYGGVVFDSGDSFRSQSFAPAALAELCASQGSTVLSETTNLVGHCLTVCLD